MRGLSRRDSDRDRSRAQVTRTDSMPCIGLYAAIPNSSSRTDSSYETLQLPSTDNRRSRRRIRQWHPTRHSQFFLYLSQIPSRTSPPSRLARLPRVHERRLFRKPCRLTCPSGGRIRRWGVSHRIQSLWFHTRPCVCRILLSWPFRIPCARDGFLPKGPDLGVGRYGAIYQRWTSAGLGGVEQLVWQGEALPALRRTMKRAVMDDTSQIR